MMIPLKLIGFIANIEFGVEFKRGCIKVDWKCVECPFKLYLPLN